MRRENIRLRSLAKYGDKEAKLKVGEAYLAGTGGFAKDIAVGLEYLHSLMPQEKKRVSEIIAKSLSLEEILEFQQINLVGSAATFDEDARLKFVAWLLVRGELEQAFSWLERDDEATGDRMKSCLDKVSSRNPLEALKRVGRDSCKSGQKMT
ncbi:hypothetical protein [Acidovorax sp.]|uniref:hypothetical protein n=1 Tax=Acidovorax sp. TaxID=1872122 RepID=UPI0025B88039|nr:hypothetical protein [Acidovorax sp.]MBL7090365.1 hypothetical protein [Acidovorax sp.]